MAQTFLPSLMLRQPSGSNEAKAASMVNMLHDIPMIECRFENLVDALEHLRLGALPIGSVEFVRKAMQTMGLPEPANLSYPEQLRHLLHRDVAHEQCTSATDKHVFVKPEKTKLFTGFVYDPQKAASDYDEHDKEQLDAFLSMNPEDRVWISEPVKFEAEWRAYVLHGQIIGMARYDPDGSDDIQDPDEKWIETAIEPWTSSGQAPCAFAVDFGLMSNGKMALVEVNDAWALGLYGRSMSPKTYIEFLHARWSEFLEKKPEPRQTPKR